VVMINSAMGKQQDEYEKAQLILLQKGSEKAFGEIYKRYKGPLSKYCFMLTKNMERTSDIVQQVFISVWTNRSGIDPELPFASYLFTMAKNRIRNYFRDLANSQKLSDEWVKASQWNENTTEDIVAYNEFEAHVKLAVESLPERKREVFIMSKFQGKSYDEIANVVGLSRHTIKNQLVESTRLVRQYLVANADINLPILFYISFNILFA
jgi:RNA polymerase sigma-70 factor, ECF subfamily